MAWHVLAMQFLSCCIYAYLTNGALNKQDVSGVDKITKVNYESTENSNVHAFDICSGYHIYIVVILVFLHLCQ